jgi:hypothetical protein
MLPIHFRTEELTYPGFELRLLTALSWISLWKLLLDDDSLLHYGYDFIWSSPHPMAPASLFLVQDNSASNASSELLWNLLRPFYN